MSVSDEVATGTDELYRSSIVVDSMNNAGLTGDYLRTVRDAGVTAAMVPVSITDTFSAAVERILDLRELVDAQPDVARIVHTVADIHDLKREGKLGLILALEDSRQLDKDLRKVRLFHELGVRRMQLVYTSVNDAGSGGGDRVDVGLSTFGTKLVARLQDQGILMDLCHASPATLRDAVRLATRPAIWSHTNARAIFEHRNNLTDEELDLVAVNGGVVGVSGIPFYIGPPGSELDVVLDHIDHIVARIGVAHVGIGLAIFENHPLSFYGRFASLPQDVYGTPPWTWPRGISTISEFPNLVAALAGRGYGRDDISAILGGNHLRVLAAAWS
jgi:membrane dipeptidase